MLQSLSDWVILVQHLSVMTQVRLCHVVFSESFLGSRSFVFILLVEMRNIISVLHKLRTVLGFLFKCNHVVKYIDVWPFFILFCLVLVLFNNCIEDFIPIIVMILALPIVTLAWSTYTVLLLRRRAVVYIDVDRLRLVLVLHARAWSFMVIERAVLACWWIRSAVVL